MWKTTGYPRQTPSYMGLLMSPLKIHWQARMRSEEVIQAFLRFIERRYSPNTLRVYKIILRRFADFTPRYIDNLCIENIEAYLQSLKNLTNRSINAHLACIKSLCHFAQDSYGIESPARRLRKLPEAPPKQRLISGEQYRQIITACDGSIETDIVRFLSNTGLRAQEFRQLTEGNINGTMLTITGKGRRQRKVPLNQTCQEILSKHKPDMKLLKSFKRRNSVYNACVRASKKAGLSPPATPHSYRHYFADQLRKKNVSIYTISQLLGHSTVKQTEIYLHWNTSDVKGVTDCLD